MSTIYHQLQKLVAEGESVALATIVSAKGSVPREVGAKMIIHPLGRHMGTVGGGCSEGSAPLLEIQTVRHGSRGLTGRHSMQSPGVRGGVMDVFIER